MLIDNNTASGKDLKAGIVVEKASTGTGNLEYWDLLMVGKGNQMQTKKVVDAIDVYGSYLIGETPNNDEWITDGNPEVLTDTWQGTQAIDKNQSADNKSQHNKLDGNEGWTLMSEMGKQVLVEDKFLGATIDINTHAPFPIHVIGGNTWIKKNGTFIIPLLTGLGAIQSTGNAIYTLDLLTDGEIKMLFYIMGTGSTGPSDCGIVFRYHNNTNYWHFYIQYQSNPTPTASINLDFGTTAIKSQSVTLVAPCVIVLKVILKGNFISVFYNDLLIWTINDYTNASYAQHGIRSNSNTYLISNFKFIK